MSGKARTIKVDYLARVEGEGSLTVRLFKDRPAEVRLSIFEPPRLFEALLRGRSHSEVPDIASRICGICPVAYLTSACNAIEDALGIELHGALRDLRRLFYCGEWIESHALHVFLLHAPDFLGYPDAIAMAKDHHDWVKNGLKIKKAGNAIVARLGGREIHPINIRVGGFYRTPLREEVTALVPELRAARDLTRACLPAMAALAFPNVERPYEFVALQHEDEYPIARGRIVSSSGLDIGVREYDDHFVEEQVPWSNALQSRMRGRGSYLCGPLARFNLSFDKLFPEVQEAARSIGLTPPCRNPHRSLLVRLIEVLQAFEEALRIIDRYEPPPAPCIQAGSLRAATGYGASEAPRGMLYHRYTLDDEGTVLEAKIVPPTSQNQLAMEEDLAALAPDLSSLPLAAATTLAERAVRNHDPCISCAAHFLTLKIEED